jgi:hypothetical protein
VHVWRLRAIRFSMHLLAHGLLFPFTAALAAPLACATAPASSGLWLNTSLQVRLLGVSL